MSFENRCDQCGRFLCAHAYLANEISQGRVVSYAFCSEACRNAQPAGPCGYLIRDGQTSIGACDLARGHAGEHMRCYLPPGHGPCNS